MKYWDTSALVPLLSNEPESAARDRLLRSDPVIAVWWGSRVECVAALVRKDRECGSPSGLLEAAIERLEMLARSWIEIQPTDRLRRTAERCLRVHALRSADALQLAAALEAARNDPRALPFVCADAKLRAAAAREGFPTIA